MKLKKSYIALIIIGGLALAADTFARTFSLVDAMLVFIVAIPFGFAGAWFGGKIREKVQRLRRREH
ncbi:MAG: hypothetical protein QW579_04165 [Desulfurococcaceae archaeon]